jgi:hypothetical protein
MSPLAVHLLSHDDSEKPDPLDKRIRLYYALAATDDAKLVGLRQKLTSMMEEWRQTQEASKRKPVVATVKNDEWRLQAA